jgi:hypothetical protein
VIEILRKHEKEIKARYSVTKVMMNIFTAESPKILLAHILSALSALSAVSNYENRKGIVYGA